MKSHTSYFLSPFLSRIYCTTYCNHGHRVFDGKPVAHECRILPPSALKAEMAGNFELAQQILQRSPARWMRRGVRV